MNVSRSLGNSSEDVVFSGSDTGASEGGRGVVVEFDAHAQVASGSASAMGSRFQLLYERECERFCNDRAGTAVLFPAVESLPAILRNLGDIPFVPSFSYQAWCEVVLCRSYADAKMESDISSYRRAFGLAGDRRGEEEIKTMISSAEAILEHLQSQSVAHLPYDENFLRGHLRGLSEAAYWNVFGESMDVINMIDVTIGLMNAGAFSKENTPAYTECIQAHIAIIDAFSNRMDINNFRDQVRTNLSGRLPMIPSSTSSRYPLTLGGQSIQVDSSPYIPLILELMRVVSLNNLLNDSAVTQTALQAFLKEAKKHDYFDSWIVHLIRLQHLILLITPILDGGNANQADVLDDEVLVCDDDRKFDYIEAKLHGIAFLIQKFFSYELREAMGSDRLREFHATQQSGDAPFIDRLGAKRMLLHRRLQLPWEQLSYLGKLISEAKKESGSDSLKAVRSILRSNIMGIAEDLNKLRPILGRLIAFEIEEYKNPTATLVEQDVQPVEFSVITGVANHIGNILNFNKIRDYLDGIVSNKRELHTEIGWYAMIRALQVVGEAGKRLDEKVREQSLGFWQQVGRLRNCICHLERESVRKRLMGVIHRNEHAAELIALVNGDDFEKLYSYVDGLLTALLEKYPAALGEVTALDSLPGIEKLVEVLDDKQRSTREGASPFGSTEQSLLAYIQSRIVKPFSADGIIGIEEQLLVTTLNTLVQFGVLHKGRSDALMAVYNNRRNAETASRSQNVIDGFAQSMDLAISNLITEVTALGSLTDTKLKIVNAFAVDGVLGMGAKELRFVLNQLVQFKILSNDQRNAIVEIYNIRNKQPLSPLEEQKAVDDFVESMRCEISKPSKNILDLKDEENKLRNMKLELQQLDDTLKITTEKEEHAELNRRRNELEKNTKLQEKNIKQATKQKKLADLAIALSKVSKKSDVASGLRKSRIAAENILHVLNALDNLTRSDRSTVQLDLWNRFQEKPLLYMACEVLVSAFRKHAEVIVAIMPRLRGYESVGNHEAFNVVESSLRAARQNSNSIVHSHDVTDIRTQTQSGDMMNLAMTVMQLIDGIPYGEIEGRMIRSYPLRNGVTLFKERVELILSETV